MVFLSVILISFKTILHLPQLFRRIASVLKCFMDYKAKPDFPQ